MPIKNYTSTVDVYTSLGKIQGALASHGARQIMVDYDEAGQPVGVAFAIETLAGRRGFLLPASVDGVVTVFAKQKIKADREQAAKTAWKNLQDWVLAQMAIIEAGMAQLDEVFLPYLTDGRGRTLYSLYQSGQLALGEGEQA
jgi:hypothetical protein